MTYTILSAQYANPELSAAVLQTQEAGAVVASQADRPHLWAQMLKAVTPAAYVEPFDQAAAMRRLRTVRAPILNALAGIGFDALAGDTATVNAVKTARQGLKDVPTWPAVLAATTDAEFNAAVVARYKQLAAAAPASVRAAFKEMA